MATANSQLRVADETIDIMFRAPVIARKRLLKLTAILDNAAIPYAVIGGHAVAYWVASEEPAAVRTTPNPNILVRRSDFERAIDACLDSGLTRAVVKDRTYIRFDNQHGNRASAWFLMAQEKFAESDLFTAPDVSESMRGDEYQVIDLRPLVIMKLVANRLIDKVHVRDLLNVDAIHADWLDRVPAELKGRLNEILDDPFG